MKAAPDTAATLGREAQSPFRNAPIVESEFRDQYARAREEIPPPQGALVRVVTVRPAPAADARMVGQLVIDGGAKGNKARSKAAAEVREAIAKILTNYEGDAPLASDPKSALTSNVASVAVLLGEKFCQVKSRTLRRHIGSILAQHPHLSVKVARRGRPKLFRQR